MGKSRNLMYLLGGLAGLLWLVSSKTRIPGLALDAAAVRLIAAELIERHNFNVSPDMIVAMAEIESNFNPLAMRYEAHINDVSVGLMQTLASTARWLANSMGYDAYGTDPSLADLADPEKSIYYGCAYCSWLRTYAGKSRSDEWVVRSYNGGPGADNPQTENHWAKYQQAIGSA